MNGHRDSESVTGGVNDDTAQFDPFELPEDPEESSGAESRG